LQPFVERIEDTEAQALGSFLALGDDNRQTVHEVGIDQPDEVARPILAVAIHHDDGIIGVPLRDFGEPHRDRALMTEIAYEAQDFDALKVRGGRLCTRRQRLRRAIVDADGRDAHGQRPGSRADLCAQGPERLEIVADWSDDHEVRQPARHVKPHRP